MYILSDMLDPTWTAVAMGGWQLGLVLVNFHMQCNFNFKSFIMKLSLALIGSEVLISGTLIYCLLSAARSRENNIVLFSLTPLPLPPRWRFYPGGWYRGQKYIWGPF